MMLKIRHYLSAIAPVALVDHGARLLALGLHLRRVGMMHVVLAMRR